MKSKTQQAFEAFYNNPALSIKEVCNIANCRDRTARRGIQKAKQKIREASTQPVTDSFSDTISGDERSLVTRSSDIQTVEDLVEFSDIDLDTWEITKQTVNSWGSSKNENFQVKIWLKKKTEEFSIQDYISEFIESIEQHDPPDYTPVAFTPGSKNAIEIAIHDLHFGSLCWGPESGTNYDIKIAQKIYLDCINHFADICSMFNPEQIIMPVGSDFFNVDDTIDQTANGTHQAEDTRWQKTYIYGRRMITTAVDILRQIAPVKLFIIPGNHDLTRAYYLGDSLQCWYRNCDNVYIDNSPTQRKYWQWGKCLVGLTHGKNEVKGTLPLIMADEIPALWAKTKYREWHKGHLHSKHTKSYDYGSENRGVRERILGALCAADAWHNSKGYSGLREAQLFIWNKDKGCTAEFNYHID